MRLLLDTHALLWWLAEDPKLKPEAVAAISDPTSTVAVSAATVWEISLKAAKGRLTVPSDLVDQIGDEGFEALPITLEHGRSAALLPRHHGDIFDRALVAQAQLEALTIVTRDPKIRLYEVPTLAA